MTSEAGGTCRALAATAIAQRTKRLPALRRDVTAALIAALVVCFGASCYTLNGVSISADTRSFYIGQFDVTTPDAPPEAGQLFSERLKAKINSNTRLTFAETDPDVEFVGAVTAWVVTPEAPNADQGADLNRLTISVQVDYVDNRTPSNSYSQSFSDFENFPGNLTLFDVQEQRSAEILERVAEEVFNKAFSNW